MSRSNPPGPGPDDQEVLDAYRALDRTIPDGYFDEFSSRVLARLDGGVPDLAQERTSMQHDETEGRDLARGSGVSRSDEAALAAAAGTEAVPTAQRDEHSGLHEIKALASTTRRRMSQRHTSQQEAEDSMLVGASSGSFRAVALPDPNREVKPAAPAPAPLADAPTPRRARASAAPPVPAPHHAVEADRRPTPSRPSAAPFWMLGGVATLAAAAAVAVFVFGVGRGEDAKSEADSTTVAALEAAEQAGAPGGGAEPPAPPAAAPATAPVVAALEGGAAGEAAETEPAEEAADEGRAFAEPSRRAGSDKGSARAAAGVLGKASAERSDEAAKKPAAKQADSSSKDKKSTKSAPAGSGDGKDLEDVLNEVTGGVEAPAEVEKEEKRPTKTELDRRDVTAAMSGVRSAVMKCRDLEKFEGTVTVKFVVEPSGKVSSATSTRKGPTGSCVAAAVKRARFPAFDGAPTSFTYPFLLAE